MTLREAAMVLLARTNIRYRHFGYGNERCSSCGAKRYDESGRAEACSVSCPWEQVKRAMRDDLPEGP